MVTMMLMMSVVVRRLFVLSQMMTLMMVPSLLLRHHVTSASTTDNTATKSNIMIRTVQQLNNGGLVRIVPRSYSSSSSPLVFGISRGGDGTEISSPSSLSSTSSSSSSSSPQSTYTLGVRDSIMIGHSFHGHPRFGPAGGLHGATYTVDVEFVSSSLVDDLNWVIDIGLAGEILAECLQKYNYKNLDDVFDEMTTTEFMCRQIHDDLWDSLKAKTKTNGSGGEEQEQEDFTGQIRVKLWESHKAWASYVGPTMSTSSAEE